MDLTTLCKIGLSQPQALAYRALASKNGLTPPQLAKLIGESRANSYAILSKLMDLDIAYREDEQKKYRYYAHSPEKLESLVLQQISEQQKSLKKLRKKMPEMLSAYNDTSAKPKVKISSGKEDLAALYQEQTVQNDRYIRLIRSTEDIKFFGYNNMKDLRHLAINNKKRRYGITPHKPLTDQLLDDRSDSRTALKRTWIPEDSYTAPVEWAVSGDQLQVIVFRDQGYAVTIDHPEIAESFRQIFDLTRNSINSAEITTNN